jgi:hypothetical protein
LYFEIRWCVHMSMVAGTEKGVFAYPL